MIRAPAALVFGVLAALASPAMAADGVGAECARSAEKAQTLRDAAKLVEAREQLLVCARDVCPRAVTSDCLGWIHDV